MSTITQQIVGELITHEKYTFVDGKLVYALVNDAIQEYEKRLVNKPGVLSLRDKVALQELRDVTHSAYESGTQSVILSFGNAQIIKRLLNHNVRS